MIKQKDEAEYNRKVWHSMTPEERLKITEELRENHNKMYSKEDEQGFKRVYRKFQRKPC